MGYGALSSIYIRMMELFIEYFYTAPKNGKAQRKEDIECSSTMQPGIQYMFSLFSLNLCRYSCGLF